MFDKMKKQLTSETMTPKRIVALMIFGSIILVFVFFGLPSKLEKQGTGSAARVNNTLISLADLRNETQRLEQMYAPLFGGQMPGDTQRQFLRGQAAENLISMELLAQAAKNEGILATNTEIRDFIVTDIGIFQKDGKFQRELYERYLDYAKTPAGEFEEKIRKDRKNQRFQRVLNIASSPILLEVQKQKALRELKLNVAFAKVDKDEWLNKNATSVSGPVADAEVKSKLSDAAFAKRVEDYFASNKSQYQSEAQVHAAHILIKAEAGNAASEKAALEKIQGLRARAGKEDFAALAKQYSEDAGSKAKGGDLGFFGKGRMVPEFEATAFSQKAGSLSEPVKTAFGYHLIKVLETKGAEEPSLEKLKPQIAKRLLLSDKIDGELKTLEEALSQGEAAKADQVLKSLGVSYEETGFFDLSSENVPKLSSSVAVQAVAELSEVKPLLHRLVRDGSAKYVMKLKATKTEASTEIKPLLASISRERSGELLNQWIDQVKKSSKVEKNNQVIQGR